MRANRLWMSVGAVCALAACGGGGSAEAPDRAALQAPALNASNVTGVTQGALVSAASPVGAALAGGALGGVTGMTGSPSDSMLGKALASGLPGFSNQTVACDRGGRWVSTATDLNANGRLDLGDSFTLSAESCVRASGETANGRLGLKLGTLSLAPDLSGLTVKAEGSFEKLTVSNAQRSLGLDGGFSLWVTQSLTGQTLTLDAAGFAMEGAQAGQAYGVRFNRLNAISTRRGAGASAEMQTTVTAEMATQAVANRTLTVSTPRALTTLGTDAYPSSGELMVGVSGGGSVRIVVVDNTQVRIEADYDGDGRVDLIQTKRWGELI